MSMRHNPIPFVVVAALILVASHWPFHIARADLAHRYSFETDASDSIGGRHGTLHGNAVVSFGAAELDGSAGTYVELPGDLIDGFTSVTFETWAFFGNNGNWVRVFDLGDTNPDTGDGRNYIFITPQSGAGDVRLVISVGADPGWSGGAEQIANRSADQGGLNNSTAHIAGVLDPERGWMALYINGQLVGSNPSLTHPLSGVAQNFFYLGRAVYAPDPYLIGGFEEFRVYNTALSSPQIAGSYFAGMDNPGTNPGTTLSLTITLPVQMQVEGVATPQLRGSFSIVGEIPLGVADVSLSSSAPSILEVRPNGTIVGRAPGSATITAELDGVTANATVTVVAVPAELRHRYSMNEAPGSTTVTDSVGGAAWSGTVHPAAEGGNTITFTDGQAIFPGGASYIHGPFIDLPDSIISTKQNLTIETWATWNGPVGSPWQRIFDFGTSTKGDSPHNSGNGITSFWLSPYSGDGNVVRFDAWNGSAAVTLNAPSFLPVGQESHIVCIYAPDTGTSQLWINGIRVATGATPFALSTMVDLNNWLGLAQWNDPPLNGAIREFRIYEGALTELDVVLSRQAGPDALPPSPGLLQSLQLVVPTLLVGNPTVARAILLAQYENIQDLDVSGLSGATFESDDPQIFTVTNDGALTPVGIGAADLTATYSGLSVTATVEVVAPSALALTAPSLWAGGIASVVLNAQFPDDIDADVTGFAGVTFSSTDTSIANIGGNGVVLPLRVGSTTLHATYAGLETSLAVQIALPPNHLPANLIHRYSFNEAPGATIVTDSVGTAHGELRNPSAESNFTGTGRLSLAGGAWNAVPEPAYVNLPNGLVSSLPSLTIEAWINWAGPAGSSWQRIFDFGRNSAETEDIYQNPGLSYMFLTPRSGPNTLRFAIQEGTGPEMPQLNAAPVPVGEDTHVAVVYDTASGAARLYMNGQRVATGPIVHPLSVVEDINVYLGRAQWTDPKFAGDFIEFRIYEGTFLDDQIAATFVAGPDQLPDLTPPPSLAIGLVDGSLELSWPASAVGFSPEFSPTLGPVPAPSWTLVPGTPVVEDGTARLTVPLGSGTTFYRLSQ